MVGFSIVIISGVGSAMSYKYNKRQNIHEELCAKIGNALSVESRPELRFPDDLRVDRRLSRSLIFNYALNYVSAWYVLYLIAALIGVALASHVLSLHSESSGPKLAR